MSHRTNYATREDGVIRVATHRHGGTSIPDLLFMGPAYVRAFIDEEEAVSVDALYNETWCEGLLLLDYDEKVVLFDGVSELMFESTQRRVWYPLIANVWAGWRLLHTPDPVRHLGLHLDLPGAWHAAKVTSAATALPDPARLLAHDHAQHIADEQTEVLWRDGAGTWRQGVFACNPVDLLACGPALLNALPAAPSVAQSERTPPRGLLRIETTQRQLHVWTDVPVYRLGAETEAGWPAWAVHLIADPIARQYSQQPERFALTASETEHATNFIASRLDGGSTTPFRDALRLHEAFQHERQKPAWQRWLGR